MSEKRSTADRKRPRDLVADTLRERIRSGTFAPGTRLPTQQELMEEFGVSRSAVREALAALTQDGLLTAVGRGASPTVAEPEPVQEAPRIAGIELTEGLHEAFQAEHVTIDCFCLTTETFNNALAWSMRQVMDGTLTPRSVTTRLLTPSLEADLALPRLTPESAGEADEEDRGRPLRRLHEIQRTFTKAVVRSLMSLRNYGVSEVSTEVRAVPITPTTKLYLLNGTEALTGYYQVVKNSADFQGKRIEFFDVLGLSAKLFRYSSGPDSTSEQEAAFVEESQQFFDSLWDTIAAPFPLD